MFEPAVDTGDVSREFWRLFGAGVYEIYCSGDPECCVFTKNIPALQVRSSYCTCDMGFCLPIKYAYEEYNNFKEKMILSLLGHDGFLNNK